jgi:hypothetical protein
MLNIPSVGVSIVHLNQPLIKPGTQLPDWVIEEIVAARKKRSKKESADTILSETEEYDHNGDTGAVGLWAEIELEQLGLPINRGVGIDIPPYNIEIKTRRIQGQSAETLGRSSLRKIIRHPWATNPISKKCQLIYQLLWDEDHMTTVKDRIIDLRQPQRQQMFQQAFDSARQELVDYYSRKPVTDVLAHTKTAGGIYLETSQKSLSKPNSIDGLVYQFRVRSNLMTKWEIAGRKNTYNSLFED